MLKTSLLALHTAIFQRLEQDTALNAVINGVFDDVDEGTVHPYVTVGEPDVSPLMTKTSYGEEITIVLHSWSRYPGKQESYRILNLMLQAITKQPLHIEGFTIIGVRPLQMTVITDIDDVTRHGIMRLRFQINN